jgi:hypothetical protein
MADDAEMTLIPSNTEPATGSAAAEPPKQDTTNIFGRFKKKLLFAEETVPVTSWHTTTRPVTVMIWRKKSGVQLIGVTKS